jgi:hypothetical protein
VNGEVNGPEFDKAWRARGIRQTIYVSTQGEERLFPEYFPLPSQRRLHPARGGPGRVESAVRNVAASTARQNSDLMGMIVAGWADSGLHPSAFWLGYATIAAAGWKPDQPPADEAMSTFFSLFHGRSASQMRRVYQLLSQQAQFFSDSWESVRTDSRKGIWGNSNRIYNPREPAHDQSIPLPPVPNARDLSFKTGWLQDNAKRIHLAELSASENEELIGLLYENFQKVTNNRHTIEVFLTVARLCRHNAQLLTGMARIAELLETAQSEAQSKQGARAVAAIDQALAMARRIREDRDAVLAETTRVWEKTWWPRVPEANGRKLLHELDDVKDHFGDRTVDLSYLLQRETLLPLNTWMNDVKAARDAYVTANGVVPQRTRRAPEE